jgi:hypothetical protein
MARNTAKAGDTSSMADISTWTRWGYAATTDSFRAEAPASIVGQLTMQSDFPVDEPQRQAWLGQIALLKQALGRLERDGAILFEYSIPRLGRRIDVVMIIEHVLFVLEFKVGDRSYSAAGLDQVWDYALDLKHFHEPSHQRLIAPILVATSAPAVEDQPMATLHQDGLLPRVEN